MQQLRQEDAADLRTCRRDVLDRFRWQSLEQGQALLAVLGRIADAAFSLGPHSNRVRQLGSLSLMAAGELMFEVRDYVVQRRL
jgi:hypothetical protein